MKKVFSIVLSIFFLCSVGTTSVFAENRTTFVNSTGIIETRFSDFINVYATLTETSLGFYHVEGGAGANHGSKWVEVTVTIEGCNSNGDYVPIEGFEWSASGTFAAATQATRDLPRGTYRAHTVAKCYLNGVLLETADAYSGVVNVPN